jgi:phosphate transport system permease protein
MSTGASIACALAQARCQNMQKSFIRKDHKDSLFKQIASKLQHGDRIWQALVVSMSLLAVGLMLAIGWLLWKDSSGARVQLGWNFLSPFGATSWDPVNGNYRAWPFIYGTFITSLIAVGIALPLGLGIAVFLSELCPAWLRPPLSVLVELLAAIPSVVYGLWGIYVFLPSYVAPVGDFLGTTLGNIPVLSNLFAGTISPSGTSRLAAGMILAIMILPTIAAVSRDVFLAIPRSQREASLALGATQWETIRRVLIPYGLSGILGALILALGRALGETMAVTMVIGNSIEGSYSLLRPGYTMSSVIANQFSEAVSQLHTEALFEIALVLFIITLILNVIARLLVWRVSQRSPQEVRV